MNSTKPTRVKVAFVAEPENMVAGDFMPRIARAKTLATGEPAFEIKGTIAPVTVLCLRTVDLARIERDLQARVAQAPQLFAHAPIVLDLADVADAAALPLSALVERVRACKLVPIGVAHLPAEQIERAAELGLAVLQLGFGRSRMARAQSQAPDMATPPVAAAYVAGTMVTAPAVARAFVRAESPAESAPAATAAAPADGAPPPAGLTVRTPVRSGQVIYAKGGDLVVLAPVNPGAQVIADGHVHIYGPLRGRALAGAHGKSDARVFCQSLEAELVSIAGEFMSADDTPQKLRGKPAQAFVEHGAVRVLPL
jgi:septum site-determining protein MinC